MYVENDKFTIENYNNSKPFSSFFPSIAGLWGKPIWVFYVNRSQCISSLGTKDKNGAILEFVAANKAYRLTSLQGFRTFIKVNGEFYEPFQNHINFLKDNKIIQKMFITSHTLTITETNKIYNLEFSVEYFTIPNENVASFARILTIKNLSGEAKKLEVIDGLPIIIPYGINDLMLKNISRLAEGWYSGVIYVGKNKIPVYKLEVEPEDRPEIIPVEAGNFYFGFYYKNNQYIGSPEIIVDPDVIFGPYKDYMYHYEFINNQEFVNDESLISKNKTPCGMGYFKNEIGKEEKISYFSIVGNVQKLFMLEDFISKITSAEYFEKKKKENKEIIDSLCEKINTNSNSQEFDNYCRQTFLDNFLRGGYPITVGNKNKKTYYVYSRVHGDMEREYNNFVIMPEYFSQGNGHYQRCLPEQKK